MRVYKGTLKGLTDKDYSATFGLWGVVNVGWGKESGMVVVGPDRKAVPDSLLITWLSLRENKFYTGKFQLPKEKMIQLFDEGFYEYDINKKYTYKAIVVGLASGGVIVVWLLGAQVETEVARFQATETKIDLTTVSSEDDDMFEDDYIDFVLTNRKIAKDPIPFGLWDTYREKYLWRPLLVLPERYDFSVRWMTMYNGEKEKTFVEQPGYDDFIKRALPSYMLFNWYAPDGRKYGVDVFMDEAEIFDAFKQIY